MRVADRLHRSAVGISAEHTIAEAASIMNVTGVGALAVFDGSTMVGIVTDRDLVRRALAAWMPGNARVDAVMTTSLITIRADADIREAFELFRRHAIRRLPVMENDAFIGMLTVDDLLIDLADQLGALARPVIAEVLFSHRDSPTPVPS